MVERRKKKNKSLAPQRHALSSRRVIVPGSQLFYIGWFIFAVGLVVIGSYLIAPLFFIA